MSDHPESLLATTLNNLLNDGRLKRLFSAPPRHCALQLWVLQTKIDQLTQNRILYGRLIPYSHSNGRWSASEDDNFQEFGDFQAHVVRLNLYIKSSVCADLLKRLSTGEKISSLSDALHLELPDRLRARFGNTALTPERLVYRPVIYLLNKDAHGTTSIASPHGSACAYSAAIVHKDKGELFKIADEYRPDLASFIVKFFKTDTGLDFSRADVSRFGDIELLVFPTLDDCERDLLTVNLKRNPPAAIGQFDPQQVPHFTRFQCRLSIENNSDIVYAGISTATRNQDGFFEFHFPLTDQLSAITDSTELELYGYSEDSGDIGTLCCNWKTYYVREIHQHGQMIGNMGPSMKFDWLEKVTRPAVSSRVKAALLINRSRHSFSGIVGGRQADPWVIANRDLNSFFERLHPRTTDGKFFMRRDQGDGEGRLQFVEWFKTLLTKYQEHQIVIFDPYFEAAGLGLLILSAEAGSNYIVFTSLPKIAKENLEIPDKQEGARRTRFNNLIASCEHNRQILRQIKLRIYGLKEGQLHDRYVLVMGGDGLPVAGFNLSNSFQQAAESAPLLVTPIPADTLLSVERYVSALVRETGTNQYENGIDNPSMRLVFDSAAAKTPSPNYEPTALLEQEKSGDVISTWTQNPSLRGLRGEALRGKMRELGLLHENSLRLGKKDGFLRCLRLQQEEHSDFDTIWEMLGEILAYSQYGDDHFNDLKSEKNTLHALQSFLTTSFDRNYDGGEQNIAVIDSTLLRDSFEAHLHSSRHYYHMFHSTKRSPLKWAEFFAIKCLWQLAPSFLVEIIDSQAKLVPNEPQINDVVRLSLLSQIIGEISLSIETGVNDEQKNSLLHSDNGLMKWLGVNCLWKQLDSQKIQPEVIPAISDLSDHEQIQILGWMIHQAAERPQTTEIYKDLIKVLHRHLPSRLQADDIKSLVDALRGHMRKLTWAGYWLYRDVIAPLLQDNRVHTEHVCDIWIRELTEILDPNVIEPSLLFEINHEGELTNISALLFSNSNVEQQLTSLSRLNSVLKKQRRLIQQPLASSANWSQWDRALTVSMWLLAFCRWSQYYCSQRGTVPSELENLMTQARVLAAMRADADWKKQGSGALAAFLEQAEDLLANIDSIDDSGRSK